MPPLRELQAGIMHALLTGAAERAVPAITGPADRAAARLNLYRNTLQHNFEDALRSTYPAVARLVGEAYFRQAARDFLRVRPSRSGDLTYAGRGFADTLAAAHAADGFDYLADIARLEWLIQESLLAAEHPPLDLDKLRRIPETDYEALQFRLHPSLRLFESPYPARRIWEVNVAATAEVPVLDLRMGGERLAIMRRDFHLKFEPLSAAHYAWLAALADGTSFGSAAHRAATVDPSFDVSAALLGGVAAHIIVDCEHGPTRAANQCLFPNF